MKDSSKKYETKMAHAKLLFVSTIFIFSICIIIAVINTQLNGPDLITNLCIALGTAFGPVAIITLFLKVGFEPILRDAAIQAFKNEITILSDSIENNLKDCKKHSNELYRNAQTLNVLKRCGIYLAFENRLAAHDLVKEWLADTSNTQFVFVGTSFRGLYWPEKGDPEILKLIKQRAEENQELLHKQDSLFMRFIFTHPAFAYLREKAEGAERDDSRTFKIREEIITSVLMLREIGIPANCIKFYKGTPTLFGVMTDKAMFINPYPYKKQSYTSVGFAVEKLPAEGFPTFSLYQVYYDAHFQGVWFDDSNTVFWDDEKLTELWLSKINDITYDNVPPNIPSRLAKKLRDIKLRERNS